MQFRHYIVAVALATTSLSSFSQENLDLQLEQLTATEQAIVEIFVPRIKIPNSLTERQIALIEQAHRIASEDKHRNPEILPGLLMQETKAGMADYKSAKNECFGIFQIKISAARDVLNNFPELSKRYDVPSSNSAIKQKLIHDDEFNTVIASKYLLILKRYGYDTIKSLSLAYNQGPGGAKAKDPNTFGYSTSVVKHIKNLYK